MCNLPNDNYNIKHESLLGDEDNVYFFLDMSPEHGYGYKTIQPSGYELTVGDKTFSLTVQNPYNLQVNHPRKVGLWVYEHDGIGNVNKEVDNVACLNRVPIKVDSGVGLGYTEKMEFKLPLSELGIKGTASQNITMTNHNLGDQTLHTTGGSTGPILLAVSGFAIALLAVIKVPKLSELRKSLHE
ncbi:Firmicu-CTERM sorting domain-containing protein [Companilactobacillus crustorum]|uniref:Firmicu-CTERM sorting domain-containing protein n=2 Tax=Companilactobacillus crustorum TaxID=392416 RepID=UPI0030B7FBB0